MPQLTFTPKQIGSRGRGVSAPDLRERRLGVMIHYDGSSSDQGGLDWFNDPACEVSYQVGVADNGAWAQIAPDSARAYHAGACLTSDPKRLPYRDANSAFYAIAALTNAVRQATAAQLLTIAWRCRFWFSVNGWDARETWRIVGHDTEAVYSASHAKAGQRGRKIDPTGPDRSNPILCVDDIRHLVPLITL